MEPGSHPSTTNADGRDGEHHEGSDPAPEEKTPLGITLTFLALGGACIVFAVAALSGRKSSAPTYVDPLGDLVAQHARAANSGAPYTAKPTDLGSHEVTFPGILSDKDRPTTALAAVRGNSARFVAGAQDARDAGAPMASLPAGPMPGVSLPAQAVLEASPVVTRPRDALTRVASESGQIGQPAAPSVPVGREGGYQLQISSFRARDEAARFADQLRARGHKAYVREAHVPGRGTWYRVRVGPFGSQQAAAQYRSRFEAKEHVVPFVMKPQEADAE
ncbi:SPOR domain-containing protein [Pendulispora albinea]|uniref:SPOR domain-containing protein n=1 Tax=Pendulispora albinea TaxID=2741071 RepID=A0ABZ2M9Q4_9BACT